MTLLYRRQAIALALESTPGTAETLDSGDAAFVVQNISASPNIQQIERDFFRDSLGSIPSLTGVREGSISFESELTGSGNHVTTAPPWATLIRACGFGETVGVQSLAIGGTITNGPFVPGDVVTGGTSSATGTVAVTTYTGTTTLYVHTVTGTFQNGETITAPGSKSVTAAGASSPAGRMYKPVSTGFQNATVGHYIGDDNASTSLLLAIAGALGNMTLNTEVGDRVRMSFEFTGSLITPSTDPTFFASTEPAAVPPQFLAAQLKTINGYAADVQTLSFGSGNTIAVPRSSNTASGLTPAKIVTRRGEGSIDPLAVLQSVHNSYSLWFNNNTGSIQFRVGSVAGNRFVVDAPRAQYVGATPQDRDGAVAFQKNLQLHDLVGNDHLIILAV